MNIPSKEEVFAMSIEDAKKELNKLPTESDLIKLIVQRRLLELGSNINKEYIKKSNESIYINLDLSSCYGSLKILDELKESGFEVTVNNKNLRIKYFCIK